MAKHILKKDHLQFIKDAKNLFIKLGFTPMKDEEDSDLRIQTDYGVFTVHVPKYFGYKERLVDINGRFNDTSVFGEWGSKERKIAKTLDVSLPSGKWNVLDWYPDRVLEAFERRMKSVNARPFTAEELAILKESDEKEEKYWEKMREEWAQRNLS